MQVRKLVVGQDLAMDVLEALGLSLEGVVSVDLHIGVEEVVTVSVTQVIIPTSIDAGKLTKRLKRYVLLEVGD